jgi:Uma2 family endonuclease
MTQYATDVAFVDTVDEDYYPETDGAPMAETDYQRGPLIYAVNALDFHFANDPQVYVSGDLLIYYEQGNNEVSVAPDVFVVFGVPKRQRPTYKMWEEGKGPDVVIEITSRSTRRRDEYEKPSIYYRMGVQEYFQYDPTGDYLTPALRGRRMGIPGGGYEPIPPLSHNGGVLALPSRVLHLELHLEGQRLRLYDPVAKSYLLPYDEAEAGRRHAIAATQAAEAKAQQEEEARRIVEVALEQIEAKYHTSEEERKRAEAEAQREAEERKRAEAKYYTSEEERKRAEEKAQVEAEARKQAEDQIKALEEELQRLRQQGA